MPRSSFWWRRRLFAPALPLLLAFALGVGLPGAVPASPPAVEAAVAVDAGPRTSAAGLVGEEFRAIERNYYNPVSAAELLNAAWLAAVSAAAADGDAAPPAAPDLSGSADAAF